MSSFVLSKHLLLCFFCVKCLLLCFLEGNALAQTVTYLIEDDSDVLFYTKDLAELYKTRLRELSGIDYIRCLGWTCKCWFFNCSIRLLFLESYSSKLQSFKFKHIIVSPIFPGENLWSKVIFVSLLMYKKYR